MGVYSVQKYTKASTWSKIGKCCKSCFRCKKYNTCNRAEYEEFFYKKLLKEHNKLRKFLGHERINSDNNLANEARICAEYACDSNSAGTTVCVTYDYEIFDSSGKLVGKYQQIDCFFIKKGAKPRASSSFRPN